MSPTVGRGSNEKEDKTTYTKNKIEMMAASDRKYKNDKDTPIMEIRILRKVGLIEEEDINLLLDAWYGVAYNGQPKEVICKLWRTGKST
ncbi:hypothetical protein R1flu_000896 [Riccia fluitans]|uniref:Uncharacterized protein n=1 Tax=Riccia fluitans TaxID=41844 RepID=A0ABD1Y1Q7_9MARC